MRRFALILAVSCARTELDEPGIDAAASTDATPEARIDADWPDAANVQACRDAARIIHVDTDGGFSIDASSATITGEGVWSSTLNGSYFQVRADGDTSWYVAGSLKSFDAGTYSLSGDIHVIPWVQVRALSRGCSGVTTGTFTIYVVSGAGQGLSNLLVSFDLRCNGQGSLTGCARFSD